MARTVTDVASHQEPWDSQNVSTWVEQVTAIARSERAPVWNAAGQVPSTPAVGDWGIVTYGPAGGNGMYFYDGAAWQKVTATAGTLP